MSTHTPPTPAPAPTDAALPTLPTDARVPTDSVGPTDTAVATDAGATDVGAAVPTDAGTAVPTDAGAGDRPADGVDVPPGRLHALLFGAAPLSRVALLRLAVYLFTLADVFWVIHDVIPHAEGSQALYRPIRMREWLDLPVPQPVYAHALRAVIVVGCLLLASGRLPRRTGVVTGVVVAAAFTDWASIGMSYSKVDHDHFALVVALWVLPTVGVARFGDRTRSEPAGWALRCVQIGCVAIYFLSALAKIRFGGWDWPTGSTFAWAMTRRGTDLGRWLLEPPWILTASQFAIMALELASPLLLFLRGRPRYLFVLLLAGFHLGTYLTIKIHFLPLVVCLLAFLPLERLLPPRPSRRRPASRPRRTPPIGRRMPGPG